MEYTITTPQAGHPESEAHPQQEPDLSDEEQTDTQPEGPHY